jgi:hypothetical protein
MSNRSAVVIITLQWTLAWITVDHSHDGVILPRMQVNSCRSNLHTKQRSGTKTNTSSALSSTRVHRQRKPNSCSVLTGSAKDGSTGCSPSYPMSDSAATPKKV